MLSLEGKQLGNYDVIRRIRVGGMGAVYEGRQRTAFDRRVAIKVILGNFANDREMRRRFAREARTIARLHHPHILPLIEFGDEHGILYLVMPFIDGGTLTSYLRRSLPDLSEVAAIYQQLLDAVEYAHDEGLIHRDIKSSNVLLEMRRNAPPYAYLADFGLVRTMRQVDPDQVGKPIPLDQVPGTPHYMAPEQTRGIVTPLTDIYALGVLLFQMLTGELPYNDDDEIRVIQMHLNAPIPLPSEHDASIPRELDEVIQTAMAKRPEQRYQSVAELRSAFLAALEGPTLAIQEDEGFSDSGEIIMPPMPPRPRPSVPLVPVEPVPLKLEPRPIEPRPEPRPYIEAASGIAEVAADARPAQRVQRPPTTPLYRAGRSARTTETVRQRPRITEDPYSRIAPKPHRPARGALFIGIAVPLLLLFLLLLPRVTGFSLFPVGFPLFGASPVATVYVTAQSKEFKASYVLTASPKITKPDLAGQAVPARLLEGGASGSSTVAASGNNTTQGVQAQGEVELSNSSGNAVVIQQIVLTTTLGVRVQIVDVVTVPPKQKGQNGFQRTRAVAVEPGAAGNIPAHALDGTCCNNGVTVFNNAPFTGGVDEKVSNIVKQSDLDSVKAKLLPDLQQKALQQIRQQLAPDDVLAGEPSYTVDVKSSVPVGQPATNVYITVTVTGSATSYNKGVVTRTVQQLLSRSAEKSLGKKYQVQDTPSVTLPATAQKGQGGNLYLNVSAKGTWLYQLQPDETNAWPDSIRGSSTAAALAYLTTQPGVKGVEIHLPFGTSTLPTDTQNIKIQLISP